MSQLDVTCPITSADGLTKLVMENCVINVDEIILLMVMILNLSSFHVGTAPARYENLLTRYTILKSPNGESCLGYISFANDC